MLRRRAKEQPMEDFPESAEPDQMQPELLALLDREVSRLPDKYRVPVVLCELEGTPRKDVAQRLGIPEGTLSSRLATARRKLAERLTRCGVTVSVAAIAAALSQADASAFVPAPLIGSTVRAAANLAAGASVSAPVAALTQGVLKSMFLTKLKVIALTVAMIGLTVGTLTYGLVSYKPVAAAPQDSAKSDEKKPVAKPQKTDKELLQGAWKITSAKNAGDFEKAKNAYFYFVKDKMYIGMDDRLEVECNATIDPTATPKQIALNIKDEKKSMDGIYALDGNKLKISFPKGPDDERPKDFDGKNAVVFELQRDPNAKLPDPKKLGNKVEIAKARMTSANNLKQMLLAMHNYHDAYTTFPAAAICDKNGKPLLSWRVTILPYIEQDALYRQFKLDEPWDSENNKKLLTQMPKIYGAKGTTKTHYRVFTGKGTMFDGTKGIKLTDVTDGTSNTAVVFEAADDVEWTKPEEFEFDAKTPLPKLGGVPFENGFHVGFADGSVRFMSTKAKESTIRAIITRNGGEIIDKEE
jgi:uncharacterized protein (TIGR03067 family)